MKFGIRQRLIVLVFSGLFVTLALIGTYRYFMEKRDIMRTTRMQGELSGKLIAELATPYLLTSDFSGLHYLVQNFMHTPDAQEVSLIDRDGRELVHMTNPFPVAKRIALDPSPIIQDAARLGEVRIAVYPAELDKRLRSYAIGAIIEHLFIFAMLCALLLFSVTRTITTPVKELSAALKAVIDRKDFTKRVDARRQDEIGALAQGVNYLIERLEQFIVDMGTIATRINDLSPAITADTRAVRKNAETESSSIANVSSSVAQMSTSIQSIAESSESLSASAEETSSAILEMNASNQEVARHTTQLTSSVEDVTASVAEMISSIREIAGHVESLSSAAEQTSASSIQIEATVREVEHAAKESAQLSQQVSREAQDIGVRSIQETMRAIETIRSAVSQYSDLVTRLGSRSEEIGKILGVIVGVTERTNLLALNASILAAQAGEHGRGFAVVAEEIKALAERTAGSAQDIGKLISAVQKEAREAVAAVAGSLAAVEEGVQRSHEAGAALNTILGSSQRSAEMAGMIERAMSEQSRGIKQVSDAITNVKQMMSQIASATQAQSKGTEMILHSADGMRDIARRVQTAIAEQGRGGKQIAVAADNVTARAGSIAAAAWDQQQATGRILKSVELVQDLPRQNMKRVEGMAASLKTLGEAAALLHQELVTMTVRRDRSERAGGSLKLGVIPIDAPAEMYRRFTPLADYLSRAVGRRVDLSIAVDFSQTLSDLAAGATDLAFLTPTTYIEAHKQCGARALVKALRNGAPYTHAAVVTHGGGTINRIEDLRGARFAFGDSMSTTSYLIPRTMLAEAGISLTDLREYAFLGHHDDVAKAVLAGDYDAGGLRESTAALFAGQGLVTLKVSPDVPEFNICAVSTLDNATAELIQQALLGLDRKDPEHARLLAMIDREYTGFTVAADGDYDEIRKIVDTLPGA